MRTLALLLGVTLSACAAGYEAGDGTLLFDEAGTTTGGGGGGGDTTGAGTTTGGTVTGGTTTGGGPFVMAAHPALMQLQAVNKNSIAGNAKLRIITFVGDASAPQLETFGASLPTSTYWTSIGAQYGIGALNAAAPVRATFTWPSATQAGSLLGGQASDVENYLISQLDVASPPWGAPDAATVYVLFMPAGITVSPDGGTTPDACRANMLAWHTAMRLPRTQVVIPYVVVPNCGVLNNLSILDSRTFPASAEMVAALTSPTLQGYSQTDPNHAYWGLVMSGIDAANACVAQQYGNTNLAIMPRDLPFTVQRVWSNAAAANNQVPCLPAEPNEVFFNATPVVSNTVSISYALNGALPRTMNTQGVVVAKGKTVMVPLNLWSSSAVNNWTVSVQEVGSADLTLTLDRSTGNNGAVLHLTAIMSSTPAQDQHLVRVTSTLGNVSNNDYLVVHD